MKIGDVEVLTLKEAGERIGLSDNTLLIQIRNGALVGQKLGKQWVVTAKDLADYDERRKQARGFASADHPMHGKQGPGHRRKKAEQDISRPSIRTSSGTPAADGGGDDSTPRTGGEDGKEAE